MGSIRIAIVGVGKIAKDQHVPSIAGNPDFALVATASRHGKVEGVPSFPDIESLLENVKDLDAVALCMPPGPRYSAALTALRAGKHVLLEKPPGATVSEVDDLVAEAARKRVSLFATWHSRFAGGVAQAKDWLAGKTIRSVRIDWKEDVRKWHPGQAWIWEPGGFGVFDPGINALSIVTDILPMPIHLTSARLQFPENRAQPIAAELVFADADGPDRASATFDWRQTGPQTWDIHVSTDNGELLLRSGGDKLLIDGQTVVDSGDAEYAGIYWRFAELIAARESDVDLRPLRHVADAFMIGRHEFVEPFED
ncbi:Gfo/Idh/MocA family oxidoreductase [Pseudaminobacter sp. 19-2017]|uniref:Gfo/Idh/MocA family oxidoreductase n=1 Tax=Pseudaminobacter soli (ex Zhang et al. 2022) TaxID=2831468 RepID=A0A942EBN6_9HYPH|nr:Gfo/Idh/MocA family oxidoreductase [Pseudaminobacter soli]MBS3652152.1 Gfo/Idh/MocA family oxidoreductase [Pseudaminobacter soli]